MGPGSPVGKAPDGAATVETPRGEEIRGDRGLVSVAATFPVRADLRALLDGCRTGDRGAFREIFEGYRARVSSIARHIVGSDAGAKDVTQLVFMKVWRSIGTFDPEGDFGTWIYRITVNTCLSERRRLRRLVAEEPPDLPIDASQEQAVLARQVRAAVARLSPKLGVPLVLRYIEGLSYDEIARVLGCSMGTVASRLSRGHEALANLMTVEDL